MGSLTTLRNTIRDRAARPDLSDSLINGFVTQAEGDIRRDIRVHRLMEKWVDLTANVTIGAAVLPADFKSARSVQLDGCPIHPVSIHTRTKRKGKPTGYFLSGDKLVLVPPPCESGGKVNLIYYSLVPALTDENQTNWLLDNFPNVYTHAVLARAYQWLQDPNGAAEETTLYGQALGTVIEDENRAQFSGGTIIAPVGAGI